jgi:nicotinate-nucleotide adenylyltransferase
VGLNLSVDEPLRIGVFGGAFDPPHAGHLALAQAAMTQLNLDTLRIVPTGDAWHKTRTLTLPVHRLAMAGLAFAQLINVVVDPRETLRSGPSYTIDTLQELRHEFMGAHLYLILGQDQAQALTSWHRWEEISHLAIICVAARANIAGATGEFGALSALASGVRYLEMPPMPVSATDIRLAVSKQQNVIPLVFEPVARYIEDHHLYRTAR